MYKEDLMLFRHDTDCNIRNDIFIRNISTYFTAYLRLESYNIVTAIFFLPHLDALESRVTARAGHI